MVETTETHKLIYDYILTILKNKNINYKENFKFHSITIIRNHYYKYFITIDNNNNKIAITELDPKLIIKDHITLYIDDPKFDDKLLYEIRRNKKEPKQSKNHFRVRSYTV